MPLYVNAQNNPYKINDKLYQYWTLINKHIGSSKSINMADTLFRMAAKKHDVKAQCLALIMKPLHYYYMNDLQMLIKSKKEVSDFIVKTPYIQYYFEPWNRLINYYANNQMFSKALEEVKAYQKEAIRLNSDYGISHGLRKMGDMYMILNDYKMAKEQYMKAIDYSEKGHDTKDIDDVYISLAKCYGNLKDYDAAKNQIKLYIKRTQSRSTVNAYILLLNNYMEEGTKPDSIEYYANYILSTVNPRTLSGAIASDYQSVFSDYYFRKKNYAKALEYANTNRRKSEIYEAMGDYKNALLNKKLDQQKQIENNAISNREMAIALATESNLSLLEKERQQLELKNTQMQVQQLQAHEKMLKMSEEHNRLELRNKQLALERQKAVTEKAMAAADNERAQSLRQKDRTLLLEKENEYRTTMLYTAYFIIVLIVFVSGYFHYRRKQYNKRLKKEKEIAERARKIAVDALNEAKEEKKRAENADKLKSLFLQNMSHEIRTPLNAIVGFNDVLNGNMKHALSDKEKNDFLSIIHTNSDLLITLVNDILDLSKFESGTYTLNITQVSVRELCEFSLRSVQTRVPEGVVTELVSPKDEKKDMLLSTDGQRLQQLLFNFLTNACKYTEKGCIKLEYKYLQKGENEYTREYPAVEFSVTDTGCGIPSEMADRIFQRFEKLDSFKQGTGLGLNICEHIATLLSGIIYLDQSYTNGARFVFIHPMK